MEEGIRKIIEYIEALKDEKSNKRSLLSLAKSPYESVSDAIRRIGEWKNDINYEDAKDAITYALEILEKYDQIPDNGLIIYTGIIYLDGGQKKVAIGFEPFKLIYCSYSLILDTFDMNALTDLLPNPVRENIRKQHIGIWKIKQCIEALKDEKSNKMSLLSLVLSPQDEISDVMAKLGEWETDDKYKHAIRAITSAQNILEKYDKVPHNGLIIYNGIIYVDDGEKDVEIEFVPFKRIYYSSNQILDTFDVEELTRLLEPEPSSWYNQARLLLKKEKDIRSFVVLLVGLVAYLVARSTFKLMMDK